MKLVDILARELKVWPEMKEGGHRVEQDYNNAIIEGDGCGTEDLFMLSERSSDFESHPHVTRAEWQAAVDALDIPKFPSDKVEWNGGWVPPVGVEIEVRHQGQDEWIKRTINYIGGVQGLVVFRGDVDYEFACPVRCCSFRPLRTPEQIAAEERRKAVDAMFDVLLGMPRGINSSRNDFACALYDAGYRKQEQE